MCCECVVCMRCVCCVRACCVCCERVCVVGMNSDYRQNLRRLAPKFI